MLTRIVRTAGIQFARAEEIAMALAGLAAVQDNGQRFGVRPLLL
jgi:hypothetical protein